MLSGPWSDFALKVSGTLLFLAAALVRRMIAEPARRAGGNRARILLLYAAVAGLTLAGAFLLWR